MWNRKFGRNADHRKAMLRNLATSVIMYGKVETTYAKAMDMRSVVDELITLGKRGDLSARRQAAAFIRNVVADEKTQQTVLQKLFSDVAPKYADRNGGYTRVVKTGVRKGDAAPICFIELVDFDENMAKTAAKKKTTRRSRKSSKAEVPAAETVAEAPATEAPVAEEAPNAE